MTLQLVKSSEPASFEEAYAITRTLAYNIHERMLGQSFTVSGLKAVMNWNDKEVNDTLARLSEFFFLKMVKSYTLDSNANEYQIINSPKEQLMFLLNDIEISAIRFANQVMFHQQLKELLNEKKRKEGE